MKKTHTTTTATPHRPSNRPKIIVCITLFPTIPSFESGVFYLSCLRVHCPMPMRLCVNFAGCFFFRVVLCYCYNQCVLHSIHSLYVSIVLVSAFEHLHAISRFENVLFPLFSIFNRINFVLILPTECVCLFFLSFFLLFGHRATFCSDCFCLRHVITIKGYANS